MKPHAKVILQQLFKHQASAAEKLGVDQSSISRYLNEKRKMNAEKAQATIELAAQAGITLTFEDLMLD